MNISRVHISNLFSYENETLDLELYNVIVGANVSGKTNILRIMQFLASQDSKTDWSKYTQQSIGQLRLPDSMRCDKNEASSISLEFSLSEKESKLLFQLIMRCEIDTINSNLRDRILLSIYWRKTANEEEEPTLLFLYFPNCFAFWFEKNTEYMGIVDIGRIDDIKPETVVQTIYNSLSQMKSPDKIISEKFYNENNYELKGAPMHNEFIQEFLKLKPLTKFQLLKEYKITNTYSDLQYNEKSPVRYIADIFDYCNLSRRGLAQVGSTFRVWNIITFIIHNNIGFLD